MFFSAENADVSIGILTLIVLAGWWLAEKIGEPAKLTPLQKKIRNATWNQRSSCVMIVLGAIFLLVGNYLSNYYLNHFSGDFSLINMSDNMTLFGIFVIVIGLPLLVSSSIQKNKFTKELALSQQQTDAQHVVSS
jgi:hypothetical protein